eukprot:TRINITY_DN3274_c0_g3_i2.p1 TRINITY_DN3274_c0_g3~~TRINITY_DN3274_c0_g3_i2.p1  ORF type:complete len:155 (-),score=30.20 TRINITY_DN3274_c0_g3_i2:98-562(-)
MIVRMIFPRLDANFSEFRLILFFTHLAWTKSSKENGGLGGALKFPLISDLDKKMSEAYDVLLPEGHTLRGLFIIDKQGVVQHITKNAPPVGRSVDETLRLVKAFLFTDEHGQVCPANWQEGGDTIIPDPEKKKAYFQKVNGEAVQPAKKRKRTD